jgi:hypothetical protein
MRDAKTHDIPLYPELRACQAPSAERIFAVFADLTRHELHHDEQLAQTFEAELTPLQQQILDLLGRHYPGTSYHRHSPTRRRSHGATPNTNRSQQFNLCSRLVRDPPPGRRPAPG